MLSCHRFIAKQYFSTRSLDMAALRIAVIGQSNFGADVYKLLRKKGHKIVGVFTVPDINVSFNNMLDEYKDTIEINVKI